MHGETFFLRRYLVLILSILLFTGSELFFLHRIELPEHPNFDEHYYVPAALNFLQLQDIGNIEHPPLGKELIAVGIAFFGDNPLGWRIASSVFGALTLVAVFLWGYFLFQNIKTAA